MKRGIWIAVLAAVAGVGVLIGLLTVRIERQSESDEAQPAEVVTVENGVSATPRD